MLVLSTRELRLIGDDAFTLAVPAESDWERGFPADQKRNGANDLYVTPLANWLAHAGDGRRDITLVVDRRIPFRVLVEVMFTASQSGYARFHLVVEDRGGFGEILVEVPERSGLPSGVTLLVVRDGVAIKSAKGNVVPGCAGVGVGIAIPRRGSEHDRAALASCLANLARDDAELRGSVISANPGTPFQEIVMALDAVRSVPALAAAAFGVPK